LTVSGHRPGAGSATGTFTYDAAKRPSQLSLNTSTASTIGQTYDRDGNTATESRSLFGVSGVSGTGTQTFGYDNLGRVTGATGLTGEGRAYSYDRDGNRVQKSDTAVARPRPSTTPSIAQASSPRPW
jgi:YD repeat-containing protein